jgi:3-deoxy-manno-octulosonate cytidylyltransferase (CMP-KDO synthetase)
MILGIIPARYGSTRFPGKPLIDILGKTMIQRVYEQASQSKFLKKLVVATDDKRIADHVKSFNGNVIMTSPENATGTDRCKEAMGSIDENYEYIINIQGDEPLVDPRQIDELAAVLDGKVQLATQIMEITSQIFLSDPSSVKVVVNDKMEALYFSRSPVPYLRNQPQHEWHLHHTYYRHMGMYAYRRDILEQVTKLPVSSLEKAESLEQLRWLEHGFTIKCILTNYACLGVDTAADVERVIDRLKNQ